MNKKVSTNDYIALINEISALGNMKDWEVLEKVSAKYDSLGGTLSNYAILHEMKHELLENKND